ncbi:helix-turn-helix domain-containing protein [Streptomyces sp. NPDC001941]|uniref:helix-turn-helix domain-containing protein n=1 Tax=Streptomyces sp. NPDC001941 TaxID=3154659 RepID=UPI00331C61E4
MTGEDKNGTDRPGALTEEQAGRMLDELNEVIRAGEQARAERAEVIQLLAAQGWTQDRIARLTGMSQPAVSKQMARHRDAGPGPAPDFTLDQGDAPWLEGRLWGLAEEIAETVPGGAARCAPYVHALARGRERFTPRGVDELRRLVEEDLRTHHGELPGEYRTAYDRISRALDVPSGRQEPAPGSPSVRRTLARRLQRDALADTGRP